MVVKYDRITVLRVSKARKAYNVSINGNIICTILADSNIEAGLKAISEANRTLEAEEERKLTKEFSLKVQDI